MNDKYVELINLEREMNNAYINFIRQEFELEKQEILEKYKETKISNQKVEIKRLKAAKRNIENNYTKSMKNVINLQNKYNIELYKNKKAIKYIKSKYLAQGCLTSYEVNNLLNELENILTGVQI